MGIKQLHGLEGDRDGEDSGGAAFLVIVRMLFCSGHVTWMVSASASSFSGVFELACVWKLLLSEVPGFFAFLLGATAH